MFQHEILKPCGVVRKETKAGRRYATPEGNIYPSVTTVLSQIDKDSLNAWKEVVGQEEAKRIVRLAAARGTSLHSIVERHLLNQEIVLGRELPSVSFLFTMLRKSLANINTVYGIEYPVYSDVLKAAGTVDLIAKYKGKNSIIDVKTARKLRIEDHILTYYYQVTAYALMVEEVAKLPIEQVVILIVGEEHMEPQEFICSKEKYLSDVKKIFTQEATCKLVSEAKIQS